MTNEQMIAAIISAIQTDANLITLMRLMLSNNISNVVPPDDSPSPQLLAACHVLGIDTSGGA